MKSRMLPGILKLITTIFMIFIIVAFAIMIGGILLAGLGVITAEDGQRAFDTLSMTVPIQFVPDAGSYSLTSETWGTGEIVSASGEVGFESTSVGSVKTAVELIVLLLILGIPAYFILIMLRRIFSSMVDSTPFIPANVSRMRWVAGLLIVISVLAQLVQTRLGHMMLATMKSSGLEISQWFNLDLGIIVIGLIIFSLAEVFRYGLELQTETDLTVWGCTLAIHIHLDRMLVERKMTLTELSEQVDITIANLSILKTGKAKAIRFSTLAAICAVLDCQPGDLISYEAPLEAPDCQN